MSADRPDVLLELAEIRASLEALHTKVDELRRAPEAPGLLKALRVAFGELRFTVAGLLKRAERDGPLFDALVEVLDVEAPRHAQAVALGRLLGRMAQVEVVREARGVKVYRLRV
jgi:hypothetical protein